MTILWGKTQKLFGITKATATQKSTIIARCSVCSGEYERNYKSHKQTTGNGPFVCPKCGHNTEAYKKKQSKITKTNWGLSVYEGVKHRPTHTPHSEETKSKIGVASKKMWSDEKFKAALVDKVRVSHNTPEYRAKAIKTGNKIAPLLRRKSIELWSTKEYRDKMAAVYKSEEYRAKQRTSHSTHEYLKDQADRLALQPKVSNIQQTLYSILDDLNIRYYREYLDTPNDPQCIIGPWSFDCVIPRQNNRTLLIECNGDYWHNSPRAKSRDKSKSTYIAEYHNNTYELKYLWEHEFKNKDRVIETIKLWLGLTQLQLHDFKFEDISIRHTASKEYTPLLSKYHYLANAGRGGIAYGAYLNDKLVAVCIFSPLPRQNIKIKSYKNDEVRELSRFCINPTYQKPNFGSWLISRCIGLLNKQYKCIIAYSDTTYNHIGTIYKACNFKHDHATHPDYWYVSKDGWVMHKKTLYNQARKMSMVEADYAAAYGYQRVYGGEKLRFIYERQQVL